MKLRRILEYTELQGQHYDLGTDFSQFRKTVAGTTEKIKQKFEASINAKLKGKRVRARASRGYKQYEKDYEFDVARVTIDDYYDTFVVIAHDNSGKKPREYFLKPEIKIQIVGLSSGHPSPKTTPTDIQDKIPQVVASPEESTPIDKPEALPVKETAKAYEAYAIESIMSDIKPWIKRLMKDTRIDIRKFIKSLGWTKMLPNGQRATIYDVTIPPEDIKMRLSKDMMISILNKMGATQGVRYQLAKFTVDKDAYKIRIKKIQASQKNTTPVGK